MRWIYPELHASQVAYQTRDVLYMALMALRETIEDSTEFTPGRCRYDFEACGIQSLCIIDPFNMNKQSRDTSSVLPEWHGRGERRPSNGGD